MLIDWFTVVAQVFNFLILVWLLKRFLYKPILNAIEVRESRIAKDVADAATKQQQASAARDEFSEKNKAFQRECGALLLKAAADASAEHDRLVKHSKDASDILSKDRHEALVAEFALLNQSVLQRAQKEVFVVARKALGDLVDASLEARMVEVFIRRLSVIDTATKVMLTRSLDTGVGSAVVRVTFDLSSVQKSAIQEALNHTFARSVQVRFETASDIVAGIDFTAGGRRFGWTIAGYLDSLSSGINDVLAKGALQKKVPPPDTGEPPALALPVTATS